MGGILGAALGESAVETEARIEEAKKTATDLTGLVRKKGKAAASPAAAGDATASEPNDNKRKAEEEEGEGGEATKKARTEGDEPAAAS